MSMRIIDLALLVLLRMLFSEGIVRSDCLTAVEWKGVDLRINECTLYNNTKHILIYLEQI